MNHILTANQFSKEEINKLFKLTDKIKVSPPINPLAGKILGTLFFEPSTRTRWSFETAMLRLGGQILSMESAGVSSSTKKQESLKDTFKTVSQYADILVIRYPDVFQAAVTYSEVPVINGGESDNEHPTQALLDLYTILQYFPNPNKTKILFTGDIVCSRTVRSLISLLKFYDFEVYQEDNRRKFDNFKEECEELDNLVTDIPILLPKIDILYMTRHQEERWTPRNKSKFQLSNKLANTMKENAIIMHPLPRNKELLEEVDQNSRAVYFKQVKNGLYIRMALLLVVLES